MLKLILQTMETGFKNPEKEIISCKTFFFKMSKQILKTGFENPEKVSQVPITVIRQVLPITTSHDPAMCQYL